MSAACCGWGFVQLLCFPGPACYNHGGTEAAITDAMVVLGYLDPMKFLGGAMELDVDAARAACGRLGAKLGLDAYECAWAIRQTALADMTNAMRARISAQRPQSGAADGRDLRRQRLAVHGADHAADRRTAAAGAREAGIGAVRLRSGLPDVRLAEGVRLAQPPPLDERDVADTMACARGRCDRAAGCQRHRAQATSVLFEADMQFMRQMSELTVPLSKPFSQETLARDFKQAYCASYGDNAVASGAEIELVTSAVVGIGHTVRVKLFSTTDKADVSRPIPPCTRQVRIQRAGPFDEVAVVFQSPRP